MSGRPAPVWVELWHEGPQMRREIPNTFRVLIAGYVCGAFRYRGDVWQSASYASIEALCRRRRIEGEHVTAADALDAVLASGLGQEYGYSAASAVHWSAAARSLAKQLPSSLLAAR